MEIIKIKTEHLSIHPKFQNKFEDQFMINKLRVSIQRHGQITPIHVVRDTDKEYSVISGSRILKILRDLLIADAHCLVHANYQDALMVALELDSIRFRVDYFKVAEMVKELNTLGITNQRLQHSVSWSKEELDNMAKMSLFDWEKFGEPDEAVNQLGLF